MTSVRTPSFSLGMGVFLILFSVFLAAILACGRSFPEWAVAVGTAFIVSVSILVGLVPGRRSRAENAAREAD